MDFSAGFCDLFSRRLSLALPGESLQPRRHRAYQACSQPPDSSTHPRSPPALSPAAAICVIASMVLFLVIVPMWVLQFWNLPSKGLAVDLIRSDFPSPATPWPEALILRIDLRNRWFLNQTLTSPSELPKHLRTALNRRAQWLVYLQADPEISYASAIAAMEIIRTAHARVILLTPGSIPQHARIP